MGHEVGQRERAARCRGPQLLAVEAAQIRREGAAAVGEAEDHGLT